MNWNTTKRCVAALAALLTIVAIGPTALAGDEQPCEPGWVPTFGGVQELNDVVRSVATFDDGNGVALYAAGDFTRAHTTSANHIAKWNGETWSALGVGTDAPIYSMAVFDDGTGPALYVGGQFTTAGGVPAQRIAKWDGTTWSSLGDGFTINIVNALEVFDDGTGPALYAGGLYITTGGIPTQAGKVA